MNWPAWTVPNMSMLYAFNLNSNYFNKRFLSMIWKNFPIIFKSLFGIFYLNKTCSINHDMFMFMLPFFVHDILLIGMLDFFLHFQSRLFIFIHMKIEWKQLNLPFGWKHVRLRWMNWQKIFVWGKKRESNL